MHPGMFEAELHATQVDLGGLMKVLGEHLYSTPAVAVRELVQNAHDSIVRRRLESADPFEARIDVEGDDADLVITDTGAGLTHDEVVSFLATVGAGYTRTLRDAGRGDDLIGYFGLGFLSAFVVADVVTVTTTSYQEPDRTWVYSSRGGQRYSLGPGEPKEVGTEVRLRLRPEFRSLALAGSLRELLDRYVALLPVPVWSGGEQVNADAPPWREPDEDGVAQLRRSLGFAGRFETTFQPICVFPVDGVARGLLWIQDGATWATSDNRNLHVFVRGMLLDDDARELLPVWAGFVGGVIESSALTPVASREDLQRDDAWEEVQALLRETLIEGLANLPRTSPEAWRRVRARHTEALLGASIADPRLFAALLDELDVPTSEGDLPARKLVRDGRVHASLSTRGGFEEVLFRALRVPIASGSRFGVLSFLRRYADARGLRVVELGTEAGNRDVFRPAGVDADAQAWLEATLAEGDERVEPARFVPVDVPVVRVVDREAELKRRIEDDDLDRRVSTAALGLARLYTAGIEARKTHILYVNVDAPVIAALLRTRPGRDDVVPTLVRALGALTSTGEANGVDLRPILESYTQACLRLLGGA